jgi:hypothetical protein
LFRYCMAIKLDTLPALEIAMQYREAAQIELRECPYLAKVFGPMIKGLQ